MSLLKVDGVTMRFGGITAVNAVDLTVEPGQIYEGKVVSIKEFGAFVELAPGTDGMCHISELAEGYVKSVTDVVKIGDVVKVKVILVDDQGRIKLSRKAVFIEEAKKNAPAAAPQPAPTA